MSDDLVFASEDQTESKEKLKILIADDRDDVLFATEKLVETIDLEDKKFDIILARSAKEALSSVDDQIALLILDITMESKHAGLDIVEAVREKAPSTRILIRTGQAGDFEEQDVIKKYDISDFSSKIESTEIFKLKVFKAIRAFEEKKMIQRLFEEVRAYEKEVKDSNLKLTRFIETAFKLSDANPPILFLKEAKDGLNLSFNISTNSDFKDRFFFLKTEIDFDRVKREKAELKNTEGYRSSQVSSIIENISATNEKEKIKKSLSSLKDLLSEKELKELLNHLDFEKKRICEEILPFALKNSFKREMSYIVGDFVASESIEEKKKIAQIIIKLCEKEGTSLKEAGIPESFIQELRNI